MKKNFFAIVLVAAMLVIGSIGVAASNNYSDWFDLDRINAVDVEEDLRDEASREEVALLIAELCDKFELLPSKRVLDFDDDDDFMSSSSYKMVTRLTSTGIFTGYPDGDFRPEDEITRAETVTVLLRLVDYLGLETDSYRRGSSFTDTEDHWAEVYCDRAYEQGLISGRGNGRFYPDDEITREEVITILVNLMGESNNPLIWAIDKLYDLEFENEYYYDDEDDRYNRYDDDYYDRYNRYDDDDDYEELTKRPVVNTGSNSSSSSSSSSKRPERPVVDLTSSGNNSSSGSSVSNGTKPDRPVVDLTSNANETNSVERPVVDTSSGSDTASSSRPTRPTV